VKMANELYDLATSNCKCTANATIVSTSADCTTGTVNGTGNGTGTGCTNRTGNETDVLDNSPEATKIRIDNLVSARIGKGLAKVDEGKESTASPNICTTCDDAFKEAKGCAYMARGQPAEDNVPDMCYQCVKKLTCPEEPDPSHGVAGTLPPCPKPGANSSVAHQPNSSVPHGPFELGDTVLELIEPQDGPQNGTQNGTQNGMKVVDAPTPVTCEDFDATVFNSMMTVAVKKAQTPQVKREMTPKEVEAADSERCTQCKKAFEDSNGCDAINQGATIDSLIPDNCDGCVTTDTAQHMVADCQAKAKAKEGKADELSPALQAIQQQQGVVSSAGTAAAADSLPVNVQKQFAQQIQKQEELGKAAKTKGDTAVGDNGKTGDVMSKKVGSIRSIESDMDADSMASADRDTQDRAPF